MMGKHVAHKRDVLEDSSNLAKCDGETRGSGGTGRLLRACRQMFCPKHKPENYVTFGSHRMEVGLFIASSWSDARVFGQGVQ